MAAAKQTVELSEEQVHLIARAIADPLRYEILKKLRTCKDSPSCTAMCEFVGISPATLSHHMKELVTAGLVRPARGGKFVYYTPCPDILDAYLNHLKSDLA